MRTLLLFDLDGTLVLGQGAGRRAIARAFAVLYGADRDWPGLDTAGRTDTGIFQDMLEQVGRDPAEAWSPILWNTYCDCLVEEVQKRPGRLAPGVPELLERLRPEDGLYPALGTGNLERGARIKLQPHGINDPFPVGGFGSDTVDRAELVRVGVQRARDHYGTDFDRVVVIGDTPRDLACARANGYACVLVATGPYDAAALRPWGADALLGDLADPQRVLAVIEGLPRLG